MMFASYLKSWIQNRNARVTQDPIIIFGNQKSGTSAIAHLLAEMSGISKTVDIPPLWPPVGFELMRGDRSIKDVVDAHPRFFSSRLIKEPMMTFFAEQVLDFWPQGRFIYVSRNPYDNIRSLLNRYKLPGHLPDLSDHDRSSLGSRVSLVSAAAWGVPEGTYIEVLAHRCKRAAEAYSTHAGRMILVRYEDFMADKVGTIRKLALILGLEERNSIAAKMDVQFQPRGDRSAIPREFFGPDNLNRIKAICGQTSNVFGYDA